MNKEEFQSFALEHVKKLAVGKATLEDCLQFLQEMPPELRKTADQHGFPLTVEESVDFEDSLRTLIESKRMPGTPESSQCKAVLEASGVSPNDLEALLSAIPNVRAAKAGIDDLEPRNTKAYAKLLQRQMRESPQTKETAEMFGVFAAAAAKTQDPLAKKLVEKLIRLEPDLPNNPNLKNFQLPELTAFLLENWSKIEGWEPDLGLCDFSRNALLDYLNLRLDPNRTRARELTSETVEKLRKRKGLKRRPPVRVKTVATRSLLSAAKNPRQIILGLKGGQVITHTVSPL